MAFREIDRIYHSFKVNMGGIILEQPLPQADLEQLDPFLLIHHWDDVLPGNQSEKDLGVGPHPHRGFAPVSVIFNGSLHHRDSHGNKSIVEAGGTQWMNSGKGIIHSERPSAALAEKGGPFEFIQFWVNAPAKHKMDLAKYQALSPENTPKLTGENQSSTIHVIAGEFKGHVSPIETYSPMTILRIDLDENATVEIPIPKEYNCQLYLLDGQVLINENQVVEKRSLVVFNSNDEQFKIKGIKATRMLLLSGKPLDEPLATHGPFVMNNQKELMEAIRDYQAGRMGYLVEDF